jgi:pilus assembly protein CpaE
MRCIVIGTSRTLRSDLEYALAAIPGTTLMRTLDHYPHQYELTRLFEAYGPDLVFVEMNDLVEERDTIIAVEKLCPHVVIVGIRDSATQDLMGAMRLGVREFLTAPITANTVTPVVNRVFELMGARASVNQSTSLLFTFLPSKPGVGTTTIAVNTALALADRLDGQTVLVDFDQSSGMIGFLLNLQHD